MRCRKPHWIRYGSMMSSMASRGSDSAAASVSTPWTGAVDFERGERLVGDGAVDRRRTGDGSEIAHAAQQPAGDARRAAGAARDLV